MALAFIHAVVDRGADGGHDFEHCALWFDEAKAVREFLGDKAGR